MLEINKIHLMDCFDGLKLLDDESVNCCVTSPPYYGLRDYGVDNQIGLEPTAEEYIARLVSVFSEVKRVLRYDGTLWVNIGDSYAGSGKGRNSDGTIHKSSLIAKQGTSTGTVIGNVPCDYVPHGCKPKDLIGVPWMLAFALRADGWYLRQDIIWAKPNPMPESVKDRCTKSHEYIFLLSKSAKYYYDSESIAEPVAQSTIERLAQDIENQHGSDRVQGKTNGMMKAVLPRYGGNKYTANQEEFYRTKSGSAYDFKPMRNKRDVWNVATQPFREAHFATFPPKLIEPCILAGCPVNGVVLDPFMGSGTTAMVSLQLQRQFIGFELNGRYTNIADNTRLSNIQIKMV